VDTRSFGFAPLSQVSALDKKLSLHRDSPFQRRRKENRRSMAEGAGAPGEDDSRTSEEPNQENDHENGINIIV
jgi:hypothetical protein